MGQAFSLFSKTGDGDKSTPTVPNNVEKPVKRQSRIQPAITRTESDPGPKIEQPEIEVRRFLSARSAKPDEILETPEGIAMQLSDWSPPGASASHAQLHEADEANDLTFVRRASFISLSDADSSNDLLDPKFCTMDEGCFCWRCFRLRPVDGCNETPESEADTDEEPPRSPGTESSVIALSPVIQRQNAIASDYDEMVASTNAIKEEIARAKSGAARGSFNGESPENADNAGHNPMPSTSKDSTSGRKRGHDSRPSNLELWRRACPSLALSPNTSATLSDNQERPKAKVAAWRKRRRLHFLNVSYDSDGDILGATASSASHFEVTVDDDEQNAPTESEAEIIDDSDEDPGCLNMNVSADDSPGETDEDDIRNDLVDDDVNVRRRADDELHRKHPRPSNYISRESYDNIMSDAKRKIINADRGVAEKLPTNAELLFHYPESKITPDNPEGIMTYFLTKAAKHHIPLVFVKIVWDAICDILEGMHVPRPKGFQSMRQKVLEQLPNCTLHYTVVHKQTRAVYRVLASKFRKKRFPSHKYRCIVVETRSDLKDLLAYHAELHQGQRGDELQAALDDNDEIPIHFYVDGVSPSSTGSSKMICQVLRHQCCNLILAFNTIVYAKDYKIDGPELLEGLLHQLHLNPNVRVKLVLADMPERLRLLGLSNHNAEYGCQICFAPGEKRDGGPGMTWPFWTTQGDPRDELCFENLPEAARAKGLPVGGHKVRSSLLDIQGFNIVSNVPIDPMHLFSGLTKFLWENFPRRFLSKIQTADLTEEISKIYCQLRVPSEFKRSPRPIDVPNFRANEWKALTALCGIDIGHAWLKRGFPKVGMVWLRYTFIMRMLAQGDAWYKSGSWNGKVVKAQITLMYKEVEELLGKNGCVPNLHALHHMPEWRARMPLGAMSTEKAEDFYGTVRRSFIEQSQSIGKQVHINTLLAAKEGHSCEPRFRFREKAKATDMDHIIVTNERHCCYYLGDSEDGKSAKVRRLECQRFQAKMGDFDWRECGVMEVVGRSKEIVHIPKRSAIAKGIITDRHIIHIWTRDLHDF